MRLINKITLTIFASAILVSCGDQLAELNKNPNASTSANAPEVFVAATGYYGVALEAYFNEADALYAQYWAGGPGVALLDIERYFIEPADQNTEWSFSYLQGLSDLSFVIANGNNALASTADILSVHIYQNLVDHYGDIPYFSAVRGDPESGGITAPEYDDAKLIYDDLVVRLDNAISVLSSTNQTVGDEDMIFGGDLDSWIAFANSLKLRLLMRQSITDASVGAAVINLVANGTFITDNVVIPFNGPDGQNFNPQYARREAGIGQFYIASASIVDVLDERNDPRAFTIFDEAENHAGEIRGVEQGNIQDIGATNDAEWSYPSAVAYAEDNDVILMSTWEVMFLRAEADMRFGTADDEKAMFDAAITAHFDYTGTAGAAAYIAAEAVYDAAATVAFKSDLIGVQKWISMNGLQETEGWIESRRFDVPGSNIFTNTTSGIFSTPTRSVFAAGVFPSIRLYPQTELSFNASNVPSGRILTEKVFWDN